MAIGDIFGGMNATGYNTIGTAATLWPILLIISVILVAGVIAIIVSSFKTYKRFLGIFPFIIKTLYYFGKGLIVVSIFGAAYLGILTIGIGAAEGTIDLIGLLWTAGICIGIFFGIAGIGYTFDKFVWKRIKNYNKHLKRGK